MLIKINGLYNKFREVWCTADRTLPSEVENIRN